jgi:hypothetical protein
MTGMKSPIKTTVLLALAVALTGCPKSDQASAPVETCEQIGQQCKLGGGQLGVCSMTTDGEMRCEPQH